MPYKSEKQRKYMHSQHPDIAARWDEEMKRAAKKKGKHQKKKRGGERS